MKQKNIALTLIAVTIIIVAVVGIMSLPSLQSISTQTTQETIEVGTGSESLIEGIKMGNIAPDFSLEDADGNSVKLSDFRGKVVFLNFWATWCPFCINEIPDIVEAADEIGDEVVVLFVNRGESISASQDYLDNQIGLEINHPIIYDMDQQVYRTYGLANAMPISYIIDEEGVIKHIKLGPITKSEITEKLNSVLNA